MDEMRLRWTMFDMTPMKTMHLKANIEMYKMEILMTSARFLERMDKSILIKLLSANSQSKMLFDLARNQKEFTKENIDQIINYDISEPEDNTPGSVVFELFIHQSFFEAQEALRNPQTREMRNHIRVAKKKLLRKEIEHEPVTEQMFIKAVEKEIHKWYTPNFHGEILEADGKELHIKNLRI